MWPPLSAFKGRSQRPLPHFTPEVRSRRCSLSSSRWQSRMAIVVKHPEPPVAPRRPQSSTHHGITITDDYAWLKDGRWQEVLRDPSLLNADIRGYLEAENAYTEAVLGHTAALQTKLVAEMRGRIKEDDSSVPSPDG